MDDERGLCLLAQLELILHHDPLIDEVGFLHPSQLGTFHPLEGKDQTASFDGDTPKSTVVEKNTGRAFQNSFSEGFSGKLFFPLADKGDMEAVRELSYDRSVFWYGDHKLAISVQALSLLYKTAKAAYLSAYQQYKSLVGFSQNEHQLPHSSEPEGLSETAGEHRHTLDIKAVENELMNHSKVVVLLCCDYASAWNSRRRVILQKPLKEVYGEELQLSGLVISYAPKSEQAWSYRYWLIRLITNSILSSKEVLLVLETESDFIERVAERSSMNYRAWHHRCRLVTHMTTPQVLKELHRTKSWAQSHVGDNCCFHYRRCLLLQLHQRTSPVDRADTKVSTDNVSRNCQNDIKGDWDEHVLIYKEELDWNKNLIGCYCGREALWIHRRFLFHEMIQQVSFQYIHAMNPKEEVPNDGQIHQPLPLYLFLEEEFKFTDLCISNSDNSYEDTSKQKEYAAMYKIWMISNLRQFNGSQKLLERVDKERNNLKFLLQNVCPHRIVLWEGLMLD